MGMHSDGILGAELRNSRTQQKDTQVAEAVDFFICNGGMQRELAVAPLDFNHQRWTEVCPAEDVGHHPRESRSVPLWQCAGCIVVASFRGSRGQMQ